MTSSSTPAAPPALGDDATAEAHERARDELRVLALMAPPGIVGTALLLADPASWSGGSWVGAVVFTATVALLAWWPLGTARGREGQAGRLVAAYAVDHHVDPGNGRREQADRQARDMAWQWPWGVLITVVFAALPLVVGSWQDLGTAVPGALLVAVAGAVSVADRLRQARAGRRWIADPPGPPRP